MIPRALALLVALAAGDSLSDAEVLLAKGEFAKARATLQAALDGNPAADTRAALHEAMGRCLEGEGRLWEAEAAFGSALDAKPGDAGASLGRARVFLRLAREAAAQPSPAGAEVRALAADARRWFEAAAKAQPGSLEAARGLAEALLLDHDWARSAEALRALLEREPRDVAARHLLAAALRGAGDRAAAAKEEGEVLALDPRHPTAAALRVRDLTAAGDAAAARAAARERLLAVPDDEEVYGALWDAEAPELRFAAMEEVLLAVLAKHKDHPRALHFLGHAELSGGRKNAALDTFRRKAALEPGNPQPRLQIGRILVSKDELQEAEANLEEAVRGLDPEGPEFQAALDALYAVGTSHGFARRFAEAERIFRRLTELDPRHGPYRTFLGLSLRRQGKFEEAEKAFLAADEASTFDGSPRNELGLLYLGAGRIDDAKEQFRLSAERDSRFTAPLENLGNLARLAGRLDEARERFLEAYRRAARARDEDDRLKFRRYLDVVAREQEESSRGPGARR